jgi:hypothetical protein
VLAFVFVDPLDLDIEEGPTIDDHTGLSSYLLGKPLFVGELDA